MKSKSKSPIWPYLAVLACLFALSITAPRAWDRISRQENLSQMISAHRVHPAPARNRKYFRYPRLDAPTDETLTASLEPAAAAREADASNERAVDDSLPMVAVAEEIVSSFNEPAVPAAPTILEETTRTIESPPEIAGQLSPLGLAQSEEPISVAEPVEETASQPAGAAASRWPVPRALIAQLHQLGQADSGAGWAEQAIKLVERLCGPAGDSAPTALAIVAELRGAIEGGTTLAVSNAALASQRMRAQYALSRWIDIWEPTISHGESAGDDPDASPSASEMAGCLQEVTKLLAKGAAGAAWRKYLHLDELAELAVAESTDLEDQRRRAARQVLDQFKSSQLTAAQRKFATAEPLVELQRQLRSWAAEPISADRLLSDLERYEQSGLASDARLVADDVLGLSFANDEGANEIGQQVESHYRNANVRLAIAGPLVNRLLPEPKTVESPIRDMVMNVPVFGSSTIITKLRVQLIPDPERIRLGLEASGVVSSDTVATSGPAKFRNQGQSSFVARKLVVFGPGGMQEWPAVAHADNNYSNLVAMETNFDGVPLVGPLVRNIARTQHDDAQGEAQFEIERKVATRARDQFDQEVRPHLAKLTSKIQSKRVAAIERLGLEFVPVALSTTEDRAVARLRLASSQQLGAHTPRPQAPSDSWLSLQIHQSALNNVLEQLDLDGRSFALVDLFSWVGEKLNRNTAANRDDLPDNVHLKFAKTDAVRLRCESGRMEVIFALAELSQGRNHWRNFSVHAFYVPQPQGLDARFVRDSTISLEGKTVKGAQPLLRAIFSKVLSRNRDLRLLDEQFIADPRMKDLKISQFLLEDGWIGLAYSPVRAAGTVARKPK